MPLHVACHPCPEACWAAVHVSWRHLQNAAPLVYALDEQKGKLPAVPLILQGSIGIQGHASAGSSAKGVAVIVRSFKPLCV